MEQKGEAVQYYEEYRHGQHEQEQERSEDWAFVDGDFSPEVEGAE